MSQYARVLAGVAVCLSAMLTPRTATHAAAPHSLSPAHHDPVPAPDAVPAPAGADRGIFIDISISALSTPLQRAREGDYPNGITGVSFQTTSCNVGDVPVSWQAPMNEDHPFIVQNMYRLHEGVPEQIGTADVKHGFFSTNTSTCGVCTHPGTGTLLGVGCSDTYGNGNNADRTWLAPRAEVNPFLGTWNCTGSHFAGGQPDCVRRHSAFDAHGPTEHMLRVADADLGLPGAQYYYEGYYIVGGDGNKTNNVAWRPISTSWNDGVWIFTDIGTRTEGPVIHTWGGLRTTIDAAPNDGLAELAVLALEDPQGSGSWVYTYALYNRDMDRRVRSFSLPVGPGVIISDIAFHDVDFNPANDWTVFQQSGTIVFQTDTFAVNPNANALLYGSMYNFSFRANVPPEPTTATLGLFKPGIPSVLFAETVGPPQAAQDCNMNGVPDDEDITLGTSEDCNLNIVPDECEPDCNDSGAPDECDIAANVSDDCEPNGVPDECQIDANSPAPGGPFYCTQNCDPDCNENGIPDECDIDAGTELDCNLNGVPDDCDIASGFSTDLNQNLIPDDCETDGNMNGAPDDFDISSGASLDCNLNAVPDECEIDCQGNGVPDDCDIASGTSLDENENGIPDECDCVCGDLTGDNQIDLGDFATLAVCFGSTVANPTACSLVETRCSDLNGDGQVDLGDFATFAVIFNTPPAQENCNFN